MARPGWQSCGSGLDGAPLAAIEGPKLLAEALRSHLTLACVFIAQGEEALLVELGLPQQTEILLVPREILDSSLSTETPQPVAALVEPPQWDWDDVLCNSPRSTVSGPKNQGKEQRPGPKGRENGPYFRGLKAPAPSGILASNSGTLAYDSGILAYDSEILAYDSGIPIGSSGIPEYNCSNETIPLLLVLAGLQDPGNLGTILRSAEAFGATGILSLPGTVSAWNPKAVRASAGSLFRLPLLSVSAEECFVRLRQARVNIWTTALHDAEAADRIDLAGPVALLIGNEGSGVPLELAALADGAVTITCSGPVESLNASVAASILLYEVSRQRAGKPAISLGFDGKNMLE